MATRRAAGCALALAALALAPACSLVPPSLAPLTGGTSGRFPVIPPFALIQAYSAPAQVNMDATRLGTKRATGEAFYLGYPFNARLSIAFGALDARAIASRGGIQTISHMDYRVLSVLGIFTRTELIVYGD